MDQGSMECLISNLHTDIDPEGPKGISVFTMIS